MEKKQSITRRTLIKKLLMVSRGMAVAWTTTDLKYADRMLLRSSSKKTIRAFIEAVVPEIDTDRPGITTVFYDPYYGFAKYRLILLYTLAKYSQKLYNTRNFSSLTLKQRAEVIKYGLNQGGKIGQLYSGAVFASQVTVYTGFYRKSESCRIIDFAARFHFDERTYKNPDPFFGHSITPDGNFH